MSYMVYMQNFEPDTAVISVSSNSALTMCYLINTCLGQGVIPNQLARYMEIYINGKEIQEIEENTRGL